MFTAKKQAKYVKLFVVRNQTEISQAHQPSAQRSALRESRPRALVIRIQSLVGSIQPKDHNPKVTQSNPSSYTAAGMSGIIRRPLRVEN